MYRYIKSIAAFLGGVSPLALAGVVSVLGLHVDPALVVKVVAVASAVTGPLATYLAPANADVKAADDKAAETVGADADAVVSELARRLER